MGKRMFRLMVPALAGLFALSMGPAQAALSLDIATAEGATVWSLPTLPSTDPQVSYPSELPTAITGSATFDGTEAIGVFYSLFAYENGDRVHMYSGTASLDCGAPDENGGVACDWSASIPFTFGPGDYEAVVTASQPTAENPDEYETVSDTVNVVIL